MAGFVIGDGGLTTAGSGDAAAGLDEKLVDVLDLGVPGVGAGGVGGVIGKQVAVFFEVGAAASRVGDDGVEFVDCEEIELAAGQLAGRFEVAVVGVEGAAAGLDGRRQDFAVVGKENVGGVAVNVGKNQILDAAGEQGDTVAGRAGGPFDRADEFVGKRGRNGGRLGLQIPQGGREETQQTGFPDEGLETGLLMEPERGSESPEEAGLEEQVTQGEPAPETALGRDGGAGAFDFGPGRFKKGTVIHSRRTSRLAGEATEAIIHFLGESAAGLELAIGHRAHQGDAPARAVPLAFGFIVGGTGGQAHAAVHALLEDGIIQLGEKGGTGRHGAESGFQAVGGWR